MERTILQVCILTNLLKSVADFVKAQPGYNLLINFRIRHLVRKAFILYVIANFLFFLDKKKKQKKSRLRIKRLKFSTQA